MKTVYMTRDFDYRPHPRLTVQFRAGITYRRVLEAAIAAIEQAGAGRIVDDKPSDPAGSIVDAANAWKRRRRR